MEPKLREELPRNEQQNEQENGKLRDKEQLVLTQPISIHVSATESTPLCPKTFDLTHEDYVRSCCDLHRLVYEVSFHLLIILTLHFFSVKFSQCKIYSNIRLTLFNINRNPENENL